MNTRIWSMVASCSRLNEKKKWLESRKVLHNHFSWCPYQIRMNTRIWAIDKMSPRSRETKDALAQRTAVLLVADRVAMTAAERVRLFTLVCAGCHTHDRVYMVK